MKEITLKFVSEVCEITYELEKGGEGYPDKIDITSIIYENTELIYLVVLIPGLYEFFVKEIFEKIK